MIGLAPMALLTILMISRACTVADDYRWGKFRRMAAAFWVMTLMFLWLGYGLGRL